jgi:cytochrome bd-type quinol oxidase subunit 2
MPPTSAPTLDGSLPPVAAAIAALAFPLVVGVVAGYRTTGRTSRRLRRAARVGVLTTVLATACLGTFVAYTLAERTGTTAWSDLAALLPTLAAAWVLFVGVYAACVSALGGALGGYLAHRGPRGA